MRGHERHRRTGGLGAVLLLVALAGCGVTTDADDPGASPTRSPVAPPSVTSTAHAAPGSVAPPFTKVMLVVEENTSYDQVIGSRDAPYLNDLAHEYGTATSMQAGYPAECPSLAAYVIMTSGDDHGICDDRNPSAHPLDGDNLFAQVDDAGGRWRAYAESMPAPCALTNSSDHRYLVRHVPATYYVGEQARCRDGVVALGSTTDGALHDDLAAGTLPELSFVTPDACNDMHGAKVCPGNRVAVGDRWLSQWVPEVLASPDYRAGRLVLIITWDEGAKHDDHIPTLIVSPATSGLSSAVAYTHCSTLRTVEDVLALPALGCAGQSTSMVDDFGLG